MFFNNVGRMDERMKTIDDFYSRWNGKDVDLGKMCDLMFILCVDLGNAQCS